METKKVDINSITDVTTLESMAYQQIRLAKEVQTNLQIIEQRLETLRATPPPVEPELEAPADTAQVLDPISTE